MSYKVSTKQLTLTASPAVQPVGLAEMKVHCRVDGSDSDTILGVMIEAATEFVEKEYHLSLIQRTYRADIDRFDYAIILPNPSLSSITSIKYYNTDSPQVLTTLASNVYRANTAYNYIYIDVGQTVPSHSQRHDAVQITYVAGYEPSTDSPQDLAGNVPEAIKSSIKLLVADLFENRETNTQLRMQELPTMKMLMAPWREY